jgi:V/A-type H+-transporting ATPase subunit I
MITPMKKVSIVCLEQDKEQALQQLRDLGVLHVVPETDTSGDTLPAATDAIEKAQLAIDTLHAFEKVLHHPCDGNGKDAGKLIDRVVSLHDRHRMLEEQLTALRHTRHAQAPFGDFSPETVHALATKGIIVKLYHTRDLESLTIPDGVQVHTLSTDKKGTHLAAIGREDFELDAVAYHLPTQSLSELDTQINQRERELADINEELYKLTPCKHLIEEEQRRRLDAQQFASVHDGMGHQGPVAYLRGFAPTESLDAIRLAAGEHGWGLLIDDPGADDNVPTLLKMPKWVTPIKAVLQMLSILPGYRESDISGLFLIFFSIFFAILIGDAGYGALFLLITIVARLKKPKAPAYPFVLFGILSIGTIVWGALTGNYFGISPAALPSPLQQLQLTWLTGEAARDNLITLCFLIGAIHLTIAHVWNTIALAPAVKALAQVGWIGLVWSMYLTALNMVLGRPYPGFFLPLFVASLVLILLFMTSPKDLKSEWIQHAMFPLSVVNCFVDIVSYIRLFAVGMASLAVAQSFNDMALGIGISKLWTVPLFALILLLGHGLNIILCALGILVHGVRLNTLEFSLHKNIEWKGVPYRPFARLEHDSVS